MEAYVLLPTVLSNTGPNFDRSAGRRASYITSVCSGSLLLGIAGLLNGYRAATHWALYDVLEALGIDTGRERVVADGNRLTGGGVTAGIDFGLTLLAELRGEHAAKLTQLMMEYDPQPPFDTGHPRTAGLELTELALNLMGLDTIREGMQLAQGRRVPSPA
ncbi:DJ-1/PfpI family protein [Pseudomonas sp. Marseille-Q7302]